MSSFQLRSACNELLGELNESIGKRNIIKLGIDIQLPDEYYGCPTPLTNSIRAITDYVSGSLINGIINIEMTQQTSQDSLVSFRVQIIGLGSSRKNGSENMTLDAVHQMGLNLTHRVSEDQIRFDFNHSFRTLKPPISGAPQFQHRRVLLAEDNTINALVFTSFLEEWGCEAVTVTNGLDAVSHVHSSLFPADAILMDINMPVMNGIEATKRIRKLNPAIPIIALTASTRDEDIRGVMEAGANDYLLKPVSSSTLFQILSKYCE